MDSLPVAVVVEVARSEGADVSLHDGWLTIVPEGGDARVYDARSGEIRGRVVGQIAARMKIRPGKFWQEVN